MVNLRELEPGASAHEQGFSKLGQRDGLELSAVHCSHVLDVVLQSDLAALEVQQLKQSRLVLDLFSRALGGLHVIQLDFSIRQGARVCL